IRLFDALNNCIQVTLHLDASDIGLHLSDEIEEMVAAFFKHFLGGLDWHPQAPGQVVSHGFGKTERRRHHADYGTWPGIDVYRLANDVRITIEQLMPHAFGDHHGLRTAGFAFIIIEAAPEEWLDSE